VLFELDGVHLERAGRPVLRELTCSLPEGASALVGPSGSGKSTTLRLLNRLADPDRGAVAYRGADVREREPRALRREVCLVPQLPALIEGTVRTNVEFAAACGGREADLPKLLRLSGLDPGYAERDAGRLSVGEQQRVMLARALALDPEVLLLDEPTAALDDRTKRGVEETLARLTCSTLLVTHERAQAERLADRVVELGA
jgi:putative ABC transport system ATP-binding protein